MVGWHHHSMDMSLRKLQELVMDSIIVWTGVLQSMGSQRVRHDWAAELNWTHKSLHSLRGNISRGKAGFCMSCLLITPSWDRMLRIVLSSGLWWQAKGVVRNNCRPAASKLIPTPFWANTIIFTCSLGWLYLSSHFLQDAKCTSCVWMTYLVHFNYFFHNINIQVFYFCVF